MIISHFTYREATYAVVFDEGFFQHDMSLEQIGIFYGELYSRFDMSAYLEDLDRIADYIAYMQGGKSEKIYRTFYYMGTRYN